MSLTSASPADVVRALSHVDRDRLVSAYQSFAASYPIKLTSVPKAGLAMMQLKESVNGDAFNIGEIPMSSATVEITLPDGQVVKGGAYVMEDDEDLAVIMAVADGAIRAQLTGRDGFEALIEEGLKVIQEHTDIRHSILNRTKVRFALLNESPSSE